MPQTTAPPATTECRARALRVTGWVAAAVALVLAAALPLLPVQVSTPEITWPQAGRLPEPTTVLLTNHVPRELDVVVPCALVADNDGATLLRTTAPISDDGLVLTADGGALVVALPGGPPESGAEPVEVRAGVPGADCTLSLHVGVAGLEVRSGDDVLAADPAALVPSVSSLRTDLTPPEADGLAVTLAVVDDGNVGRTAVKTVAVVGLVLALVVAVAAGLAARRVGRSGRAEAGGPARQAWRPASPATVVADLALVGVAVTWFLVAPVGDDDSWIMQMARDFPNSGFVGEYYYIFNGSHAPFDWWWQLLSRWLELGNAGVLWMRVPALVLGLVTWVLVRQFVASVLAQAGRPVTWVAPIGTLVAYLAWWLPFGMVLRVEAIQPLFVMASLTLVAKALERRSLGHVAGAVAVAAVAFATHPNGATAFAPLAVALVPIWRLCAEPGRLAGVWRALWVAAPLALASLIGFGTASLGSYRRNQELYAYVGRAEYWFDEWRRYQFLFTGGTLGSYARAIPVLVTLVALAWFFAAYFATRRAELRSAVPSRLALVGWSTAVALVCLSIVPSKFTHHFGTVIGLGSVLVAAMALLTPSVVRAVRRQAAVPAWVPASALVTLAAAAALGWRGPNTWWGGWNWSLGGDGQPPTVRGVPLGSLAVWVVVAGGLVAVVALAARLRRGEREWTAVVAGAVPVLAVVVGLSTVGYTLGRWVQLTADERWSASRSQVEDLRADGCAAAGAVTVWLPESAAPLAQAVPAEEAATPTASAPSGLAAFETFTTGAATEPSGAAFATSPWYALPPAQEGARTVVYVSGDLTAENTLAVEYGRHVGSAVEVLGFEALDDGLATRQWRGLTAPDVEAAELVRVVARDFDAAPGSSIAFTEPTRGPGTLLRDGVPDGATVATPWQNAMQFPCFGDVVTRLGVTERIDAVVSFLDQDGIRLYSISSSVPHGGLYVGSEREAAGRLALVTAMDGAPDGARWGGVEILNYDLPDGGYDLSADRTTAPGWSIPWPWPQGEQRAQE